MPYFGLRGTPLLVFITISAGMGWILFGYDNALLGGLIGSTYFADRFRLSADMQGTTIGLFEIGCFFGAMSVAFIADVTGRRLALAIGSIFIAVGAVLQATSFVIAQLLVGRVVAGIGMGIISSVLTTWQAETSPARIRGRVVCASLSFLIVGQLIGYWVDYGMLAHYSGAVTWRFPFALQSAFALIMTAMVFMAPESPRWLVTKGRSQEARQVIAALKNLPVDSEIVAKEIQEIESAVELEGSLSAKWTDLFSFHDDEVKSHRRVWLCVGIQSMQAFSGSTVISYYTTTIFHDSVGLSSNLSSLMSGYLQIWFLVASFGTWWLIEHAGRRKMFLITAVLMMTVLAIMGGLVKIGSYGSGIGASACIFLYQAFFTWGWMAGVWCYSTEIVPLAWRSKGCGLAVACQWLFDFLLLKITPIAVQNLGFGFFFLFAGFNALFIPVIYLWYPETASLSLELLDLAFIGQVHKDPRKESKRLRALVKEGLSGEVTAVAENTVHKKAGTEVEHIEEKQV